MITDLSKQQKDNNIYFDEQSPIIDIHTHNTDLKNRLLKYAEKYLDICKQIDDEQSGLTFEIPKGRFGFQLTAPYSEERRWAARELAKKNGLKGKSGKRFKCKFNKLNLLTRLKMIKLNLTYDKLSAMIYLYQIKIIDQIDLN